MRVRSCLCGVLLPMLSSGLARWASNGNISKLKGKVSTIVDIKYQNKLILV